MLGRPIECPFHQNHGQDAQQDNAHVTLPAGKSHDGKKNKFDLDDRDCEKIHIEKQRSDDLDADIIEARPGCSYDIRIGLQKMVAR